MSHLMHVLRRKLGGVLGELIEGPSSYRPMEMENSGAVPSSMYGKSTNPGDTPIKVDSDGHAQVDALSSALPSGAATAARQDTGNTSVASLDTKLGEVQASPTANTLLARLKAIADALAGALTAVVSGTVTANQGAAGATAWPVKDVPVACAAADINAPAANTAAVVTYAQAADLKHVITGIAWSYIGGIPVGGNLKVEDVAGTVVFSVDIHEEGPGAFEFPKPKKAAAVNTAMIVTLAAGGAGVTGKVNALNHWTEA